MTLTKTISSAVLILAFASGPAAAQMYPGQDVIVNPTAAQGGQVLLYPGGAYMRVVPPLEEPGAPVGPIHLHMPVHHRHIAKVVHPETTIATATPNADGSVDIKLPPPNAAAAAPAPDASATAQAAPTPSTRHKHSKQVEAAATAPAAPPAATTQASGDLPMNLDGSDTPPPPEKPAKAPVKVAATEPPPAQTHLATPPAATHATAPSGSDAAHTNLLKRGAVLFESGATDPSPAQFDGVKILATDLNAALEAGAARVQLEAYGGAPGDKSSDARRLSLKRALAIRQLLIDDGVPSSRIDVRAMGGIDDKGPVDRVDIYVRAS
jgi:outer membrane protein OmpA-like peptidoglycan-associated protein